MDLKNIFDTITPENIKDISLIKDAMEIFIENIEENCAISINIEKIYNNTFDSNDSIHLQNAKLNIRKGLIDVYLTVLYNTLQKSQDHEVIKAKFKSRGIDSSPFINDIEKIINDEFFITNKPFKERVGTELSIKYAYNLANFLQSSKTIGDIVLTPIKPFHFETRGSIFREMYENIVKPLSHPLGFTYAYTQQSKQILQDLYFVKILFNIQNIEIRGINGNFDVFTEDLNDTNVKLDFLTRTNPITKNLFTEEEYNSQVVVLFDKIVDTYTSETVENRNIVSILFKDRTYIQQKTNPIELIYVNYDDIPVSNIKDFSGHYSLYVNNIADYEFQYSDEIEQFTFNYEDEDNFVLVDGDVEEDLLFSIETDGYYLYSERTSTNADGSTISTITLQAKDANGNNLVTGGLTVLMTPTGSAILSSVNDNSDLIQQL
jgi:hypothetical protein